MIPIVPVDSVRDASRARHPANAADAFLRPGAITLKALPPLTLYVHIPWCVRKCPYCDFNSHEHADGIAAIPEAAYLDALRADLEQSLPLIWGRKLHAVFIGGGTPSLFSAAGMDRLLADLRALLPIEADAEITMEANPGTFEAEKFRSFRASGINRLSIGIQSFNSRHLHALGRIHDGDEARAAIAIAAQNFDNFNLDLMYALPGQTLAEAQEDLATALSFAPPHLSMYHLTLEPNTLFAKYPPPLPDDDDAASMQEAIEAGTAAAGYQHYEVSAHALPGHHSRHNQNYWNFGDYLGIGAGAHSKLSFPHRIVRQVRVRQPRAYLENAPRGHAIHEEHEVTAADLPFEFMLNALRLNGGFPLNRFSERTGLAPTAVAQALETAEARGLIGRDLKRVWPTELGRRFLNDLQSLFLPT